MRTLIGTSLLALCSLANAGPQLSAPVGTEVNPGALNVTVIDGATRTANQWKDCYGTAINNASNPYDTVVNASNCASILPLYYIPPDADSLSVFALIDYSVVSTVGNSQRFVGHNCRWTRSYFESWPGGNGPRQLVTIVCNVGSPNS